MSTLIPPNTTILSTLSLHDALPISAFVFPIFLHRWLVRVAENPRIRAFLLGVAAGVVGLIAAVTVEIVEDSVVDVPSGDRKSTRLNSSHGYISYAVFCLTQKSETFS